LLTKKVIFRRQLFPFLSIVGLALVISLASARAERLPLADNLVDLRSSQGQQWFLESNAREAYWPLAEEFISQKNGAFCGVATLVMVLNSLEVPAPPLPGTGSYESFTQENVFNDRTEAIVQQENIFRRGMTLDELGELFASFGQSAKVTHAAQSSLDEFRAIAIDYLAKKKHYVVVNYLRLALGQVRGGRNYPHPCHGGQSLNPCCAWTGLICSS
jgi:Phytochelatin synthase